MGLKNSRNNKIKRFLREISFLFSQLSTAILMLYIGTLGVILPFASIWVAHKILGVEGYPIELSAIGTFLLFFTWGWIGVIWIWREETPFVIWIYGKGAQLIGLIFVVFAWGFAFSALYVLIFGAY